MKYEQKQHDMGGSIRILETGKEETNILYPTTPTQSGGTCPFKMVNFQSILLKNFIFLGRPHPHPKWVRKIFLAMSVFIVTTSCVIFTLYMVYKSRSAPIPNNFVLGTVQSFVSKKSEFSLHQKKKKTDFHQNFLATV